MEATYTNAQIQLDKEIIMDKQTLSLLVAVYGYGDLSIPISGLTEASLRWAEFRDGDADGGTEVLGCSAMRKHCGNVYQGSKLIARVSYNGKVWSVKDELLLEATNR